MAETMRVDAQNQAEQHCSGILPVYYAKCTYAWPEFFDKGAFVYSEVRVCDYKQEVACETREEAEAAVQKMNEDGAVCPKCGQAHKFKAYTQIEILEEERMVQNIMNNIDHSR